MVMRGMTVIYFSDVVWLAPSFDQHIFTDPTIGYHVDGRNENGLYRKKERTTRWITA
jgi:hypothetical protein